RHCGVPGRGNAARASKGRFLLALPPNGSDAADETSHSNGVGNGNGFDHEHAQPAVPRILRLLVPAALPAEVELDRIPQVLSETASDFTRSAAALRTSPCATAAQWRSQPLPGSLSDVVGDWPFGGDPRQGAEAATAARWD